MNNPCDVHVDCFPCFEAPINNFSVEDPDPEVFTAGSYGGGVGGPLPAPGNPSWWGSPGCLFYCVSLISQQDADLCAARQSFLCNKHKGVPPGGPGNDPNSPTFVSQTQTCCVPCADGSSFCFTLPGGLFLANSQILANREALSYACLLSRQHRVCMSALSPNQACVDQSYSGTITASGIFLSTNGFNLWDIVDGTPPPGITFFGGFQGTSVELKGTPTTEGTYTFTVRVTAPSGDYMQKIYTLCVIDLHPDALPDGTQGTAYSQQLTATSCAQTPLSWQVTSGQLPPGLSLDETTGIISGTPTAAASFVFTITAQTQAT